ncbi:hypothetical protein [Sphingomonas sp. PR090111-T3T-6A]|uniref:hypothetical protein n=1 Tax=Sphingomonas sp. PR090111-T3T-6A TaxID=685778 RepID=UPI0003721938|nr:hypothetical protein [Sphingomonas sp. PR090111-T3T-6A]
MTSKVERQSPVTLGGVAAMGGAIALCLVGLGQTTRATPTPASLLFLGWVGAAGLIIVLCRVRLPQAVRLGCIVATLGVMFLLAAQSDMFVMKKVSKKIADPMAAMAGESADITAGNSSRSSGSAGAVIHLRASARGDLGWARRLEDMLAGSVGNASASWLTIDGSVAAQGQGGRTAVMVDWRISGSGKAASCGITSVVSGREKAIGIAFRDAFETAALRSTQRAQPVCF